MHQLSLVGTIPHSQYVQTIATLQAFTGQLRPQPISTYTLVCKPNHVFKPKFEPGKVNQIEQYYMRCITTWLCSFDLAKPVLKDDELFSGLLFDANSPEKNWTLQISDIPVAGKNQQVCAQTIYETTVVHTHTNVREQDVVEVKEEGRKGLIVATPKNELFLQMLSDLGYGVFNQYWCQGVRFFSGDVVIELTKLFVRDDDYLGDKIRLKLLDELNTFQVRVYVNVNKASNVDMVNQATKDLVKLQEYLKNLIKLTIPDRMHMDLRIQRG